GVQSPLCLPRKIKEKQKEAHKSSYLQTLSFTLGRMNSASSPLTRARQNKLLCAGQAQSLFLTANCRVLDPGYCRSSRHSPHAQDRAG
uniref:Uncharacterized protein n=1 Tax=Suricata suricatta TaxID=37032 RepID=A0A673STT2_SURSU